ncbi:ABC transporter permease [Paracoccus ravus]|uniref:ABC transporter permease n=1 Tax=Paracoccus ravus TaxID=2447760 RepID=UPI00106EEE3C|nr:ABC transporter permease [Paracoccus ravus]
MTANSKLIGLVPILGLVLLWGWLAASGMAPRALLPSPVDVVQRLFELLADPDFLAQIGTTLFRLVSGFLIALVLGTVLAVLSASSEVTQTAVNAFVRILAPLPKIALYPAMILILGFGHSSKIALVVIEAAFPIYLATYQGMRNVDKKLVWAARSAGASRLHCLLFVMLPAAAPSILTGARVALVISCIVVFLSEMMSSTEGLGYVLIDAARNFRTIDMFVPIILISALGLGLGAGLSALRRKLLVGYPQD